MSVQSVSETTGSNAAEAERRRRGLHVRGASIEFLLLGLHDQ